MAFGVASADILTQKYATLQAPLGQGIDYKRGRFVMVKANGTIAKGDSIAFEVSVDPGLFQVTKTVVTSVVTAGLAMGFACAAASAGEFLFAQVAGPENDASPPLLNDGTDSAAGDYLEPDISGTDGLVQPGTVGVRDHLRLANLSTAQTGTTFTDYIVVNRFNL